MSPPPPGTPPPSVSRQYFPSLSQVQTQCDQNQWSQTRTALFVVEDCSNWAVNVDYYTQVLGVPSSVTSNVWSPCLGSLACDWELCAPYVQGSLDAFWRGAENITSLASITWAASQAAPLRNILTAGAVNFFWAPSAGAAAYASGGFAANCQANDFMMGSQQQFFLRNCSFMTSNPATVGVWNYVYLNCSGLDNNPGHWDLSKVSLVQLPGSPELTWPKPYLISGAPSDITQNASAWSLRVCVGLNGSSQASMGASASWPSYCQSQTYSVKYVDAGTNLTQETFQSEASQALIFGPGIYIITSSIVLSQTNQVLYGLGLATFRFLSGTNLTIQASNVQLAGFLFETDMVSTGPLVDWQGDDGHIFDCYVRVIAHTEGANCGAAAPSWTPLRSEMLCLSGKNHITDNTWLWRADHDACTPDSIQDGRAPVEIALHVTGENAQVCGLFAEHALKTIVWWEGNSGKIFLLQCELPYDVGSSTMQPYLQDLTALLVTGDSFQGWGLGAYTNFLTPIQAISAFKFVSTSQVDRLVVVRLNHDGFFEYAAECVTGDQLVQMCSEVNGMPQGPLTFVFGTQTTVDVCSQAPQSPPSCTIVRSSLPPQSRPPSGPPPGPPLSTWPWWQIVLAVVALGLLLAWVLSHRKSQYPQPQVIEMVQRPSSSS